MAALTKLGSAEEKEKEACVTQAVKRAVSDGAASMAQKVARAVELFLQCSKTPSALSLYSGHNRDSLD